MTGMSKGFVAERAEENVSQCPHHWLIDPAGGPTSEGVCRLCGAHRHFRNYLDDAPWDNNEPGSGDSVKAAISSVSPADEPDEES